MFQVLNSPAHLCLIKTRDLLAIVPQASFYGFSYPQLAAHVLNMHLAKWVDFLIQEND